MDKAISERLDTLLRARGAQSAGVIGRELGVSQPTVSRLLADAGSRVVRIGRARATRYALAREIARAGNRWPLYRIDADGRPQTLGELRALHGDVFHFEATGSRPALVHGDFSDGLFPGLPWFLDDQRPQGFLGRLFARRVADEIGAPKDAHLWHADDVVLGLLRHGDDPPGDLILGEASLQRALRGIIEPANVVALDQRVALYPVLADAVLRGEDVGSSAGGEQPKFAVTLRDDVGHRPVIIKFSDRISSAGGRRWADLLICEQLAGEVLNQYGLPAADSDIVQADDRIFFQSRRFDRTRHLGRRGFVSLAALDAAYFGNGSTEWWRFASQLERSGWVNAGDARQLRLMGWFGALISNSDMHLGNVALHLADNRPLALAPVYDMSPMHFRPASTGEIVERQFEIALPAPEQQADWIEAVPIAQLFWQRVADDLRISPEFSAVAAVAEGALESARRRMQ